MGRVLNLSLLVEAKNREEFVKAAYKITLETLGALLGGRLAGGSGAAAFSFLTSMYADEYA